MQTTMEDTNAGRWLADFERLTSGAPAAEPASLRELRRRSIESFGREGFPTTRHELWRYTNIQRVAKTAWEHAGPARAAGLSEARLAAIAPPPIAPDALRFVFLDGTFVPELSAPTDTGCFSTLESAPAGASLLGRALAPEEHPFAALNTAFFTGAALVRVPAGETVSGPIHIVHVSSGPSAPLATHPRNLIHLEQGARATVVETYLGLSEREYLCNAVTEVVLEADAHLRHVKLQKDGEGAVHLAQGAALLSAGSSFSSHTISLGAALARNAFDVVFSGQHASCELHGLYVTDKDRHADCQTYVDHAVPHCTSEQNYRGVVDDRSHGVFNGRVLVREDAQKTDAQQQNANLLLSREASADTKPQLEIYADDVKCTHGATIGQLDPASIFFLRARGIGEERARGMLTRAFASEITDEIELEALRTYISHHLEERLPDDVATRGLLA